MPARWADLGSFRGQGPGEVLGATSSWGEGHLQRPCSPGAGGTPQQALEPREARPSDSLPSHAARLEMQRCMGDWGVQPGTRAELCRVRRGP